MTVSSSPHLPLCLVAYVEELADAELPAAEIRRRVGVEAALLGVPAPSYETVRRIARSRRAGARG